MAKLTLEEEETHLSMVADDRSTWEVYSDDPVMMARLDKIATAYKTTVVGKFYRLTDKQVTLKKVRPPLSEETRQRKADAMAKALGRTK